MTTKKYSPLINALITYIDKWFHGSKGSHDLEHTFRVLNNALHIHQFEKGDIDVLETAVLCHDIGRADEDSGKGEKCHAELGAARTNELLTSLFEDLTPHFQTPHPHKEQFVEAVCHAVHAHRFRNEVYPSTIEAKILFDADKLDSIGAIGIGRAFLFAGEVGAKLHNPDIDLSKTEAYSVEDTAYREFKVKLQSIKDKLLTDTGKEMAKDRHHYMELFFERLTKEYRGEN